MFIMLRSAGTASVRNFNNISRYSNSLLRRPRCSASFQFMFDKMKKIILNISIVIFVASIVYASERSLDRSDFDCSGRVHYNVSLSAYYPDFSSDNESDYLDAKMKKLRNLQDFLDGRAEFVSISMDLDSGIPYGTKVCIPELNAKFSRQIPLQARDRSHYSDATTSSPDFSHVEICVRSEEDTYDNSVNGLVTLYV